MSEVGRTKRKEKCENCTKQVSVRCFPHGEGGLLVPHLSVICQQCNKKQTEDGVGPDPEQEEVNEQV